jgi:hypothetical protein
MSHRADEILDWLNSKIEDFNFERFATSQGVDFDFPLITQDDYHFSFSLVEDAAFICAHFNSTKWPELKDSPFWYVMFEFYDERRWFENKEDIQQELLFLLTSKTRVYLQKRWLFNSFRLEINSKGEWIQNTMFESAPVFSKK